MTQREKEMLADTAFFLMIALVCLLCMAAFLGRFPSLIDSTPPQSLDVRITAQGYKNYLERKGIHAIAD